jgi:hypothetical protein
VISVARTDPAAHMPSVNVSGLLDHVGCSGPTKEQANAKGSAVCDRS